MKRPTTSILHPDFRYVKAAETDLKRTFARIRRKQQDESARQQESRVIVQIPRKVR